MGGNTERLLQREGSFTSSICDMTTVTAQLVVPNLCALPIKIGACLQGLMHNLVEWLEIYISN